MKFTKEMVDSYAEKLLIRLNDDENKMVLDEFDTIDKDIDKINKIKDIDKVEPMTHALLDQEATLRDDNPTLSPDINELLQNADKKIGREVEILKVVGE